MNEINTRLKRKVVNWENEGKETSEIRKNMCGAWRETQSQNRIQRSTTFRDRKTERNRTEETDRGVRGKQKVKLDCSMVEHIADWPRVYTLWWCGGEDNREGKPGKNKGRKFSRYNGQ